MAFKITATDATVFNTNQIDNVASAFKTTLGLDQVANYSDVNLPISTLQQTAFDAATYSSTVNELNAYKPSLDFNFATDKAYTRDKTNLNGMYITSRNGPPLSFYRNSAATFIDSDGLIKYAPENLLLYSESFSAPSWVINDANINVNATTAPNTIIGADKLVETATNAQHLLAQNIGTVAIGMSYTLSVYAKAGERTNIALTSYGESLYAVFNLTEGTVTQGGSAAIIAAAGNGWYRCSATFTKTNTNGLFYLLPWTSTNSYLGTAGSGVYIWGAQVERGNIAQTYLSTSSAVNTLAENLILYPNTFAGSYWDKTAAVSVTDNNVIGPFSVSITDATKLTETTGTTVWRHIHDLTGNFAPVSGQTYTMSIYVKDDATWSSNYLQLAFWSAGFGNSAFKNYDIVNKTVSTFIQDGATNIIASGIDTLSNGWMRIWATSTATATGLSGFQLAFVPALTAGRTTVASTAQYTRTSVYQSIYIYGAQVVVGNATASLAWPSSAAVYGPRFDHDPAPLTTVNFYGVSATTGENLFLNSSDITSSGSQELVYSTWATATGVPTAYSIESGGINYSVNASIGILGAESSFMLLKVLTVNGNGTVLTVEPVAAFPGAGYSTGVKSSAGGGGTGFTLNITAVSTLLKLNADTAASSNHRFDQATTSLLSRSSVMTVSAYVKAGEYSGFAIGQGNGNVSVAFSLLSSGSVTYADTVNGWSGTVTAPDSDGFIRCSATLKSSTYITTSGGRVNFFIGIAGAYSTSNTGNFIYTVIPIGPKSGIYIKNIQIESNLRATDYNATSGSAIVGSLLSSNTKRCKGLLIEESRTNTVINSYDLVTNRNHVDSTTTAGYLAPDNSLHGTKLVTHNTKIEGRLYLNQAYTNNAKHTFSIYLKAGELTTANIWFDAQANVVADGSYYGAATNIDLINGTAANTAVKVTPAGNGWYRCSVSATLLGSGNIQLGIRTVLSTASDGTKGIYVWGPQLEVGITASSYIPTAASEMIRAADFAGISGTDFTKFYNNSEGTFVMSADASRMNTVTASSSIVETKAILHIGKSGIYEGISGITNYATNTLTSVYGVIKEGTFTDERFSSGLITNTSPFKAALSLKSGNNAMCFNGALAITSAVPLLLPTNYDSLRFYDIGNNATAHPTMWVSTLQYYPVRKTNQFMSVTTTL